MTPKCIIFDCDGTLVDSEAITNQVIAEMASELGIDCLLYTSDAADE